MSYPTWLTPAIYIESARTVLGGIDLDPASCPIANQTVKAKAFFTEAQNGLLQPWAGRVWLNPPYKAKAIADFVNKLLDSLAIGNVTAAILMCNPRTDTRWWQNAAEAATAICFMKGRMRSVDGNGNLGNSPTAGHTFLYFGPATGAFVAEFGKYGCTRRWSNQLARPLAADLIAAAQFDQALLAEQEETLEAPLDWLGD